MIFLIYRIVFAVAFLIILSYTVHYHCMRWPDQKAKFFIHFTNRSLLICVFTSIFGAILTVIWTTNQKYRNHVKTMKNYMPLELKMYWMLLNVAQVTSLFCLILFWPVIFKESNSSGVTLNKVLKHGVTAFLMVFDLFLSRCPVKIWHGVYSVNIAVVYSIFAIFYNQAGGTNQ